MRFARWRVKKQYKNTLSNDNNAASNELKPVTLLEVQILLQVGMFSQTCVEWNAQVKSTPLYYKNRTCLFIMNNIGDGSVEM